MNLDLHNDCTLMQRVFKVRLQVSQKSVRVIDLFQLPTTAVYLLSY